MPSLWYVIFYLIIYFSIKIALIINVTIYLCMSWDFTLTVDHLRSMFHKMAALGKNLSEWILLHINDLRRNLGWFIPAHMTWRVCKYLNWWNEET